MSKKQYTRNSEIRSADLFPEHMMRIALGIEYNGAQLHGFQTQSSGVPTVGQSLERVLSDICNEPITVVCAGRTDAGVHATSQVVHFDTLSVRPHRAWLLGANKKLPDNVSIRWAKEVSPFFHARFSAQSRSYRYIIDTSSTPSALLRHQVTWHRQCLNVDLMLEASRHLLGEHDFNAYRATQCQAATSTRRIDQINITTDHQFIIIEVKANAFLYHMVRNIVGVLMAIGAGSKPPRWAYDVLISLDRRQAGKTAPPDGLYLTHIEYDSAFCLPNQILGPAFIRIP